MNLVFLVQTQKHFVLQNKEIDFDGEQFSKLKDFWQDFKEYRLSKEYLELGRNNKENSQKMTNSHHLGSRGYIKKMPEFEAELEKMDRLAEEGVQVEIVDWEPRSVNTLWGGMYGTPRTGALAPQIYP